MSLSPQSELRLLGRRLGAAGRIGLSLMAQPALALSINTALLSYSAQASAQTPKLQTDISQQTVEVGAPFTVTLSVMGNESTPSSPKLSVPNGFSLRGPSISSRSQISIRGGRISQTQGINATWTLSATKPGTYTIGPPSIVINGARHTGNPVRVRVVAAGSGPRQLPPSDPLDPFGIFQRIPGLLDDDDFANPLEDLIPLPPDEFRTETADDPIAFLRTIITPKDPVVGEPITLKVLAYASRGPFRELKSTEPTRPDFLAYPIVENAYGTELHRVKIEDTLFHAAKVRELLLVPIRAGELQIGSMSIGFGGHGYPSRQHGEGLRRETKPIRLRVEEPPAANRPVGYTIGDVGRFRLSAQVEPRTIDAGGSVSVTVQLEGHGNLPASLKPPQQTGVEWLEPNVREHIEPSGGTLGGWRKFNFTARITRSGSIDLGSFSLPYWNPANRRYELTEASLGVLQVNPSARSELAEEKQQTGLNLEPRLTLAPYQPGSSAPSSVLWYWLFLLGAPSGVMAVYLSSRLGQRMLERSTKNRTANNTLALEALKKAQAQYKGGDLQATASELERALVHAIEAAAGLKARGILRDTLTDTLVSAGIPEALASEVRPKLDTLDAVRFTGASLKNEDISAFGELVTALNRLAKKQAKAKPVAANPNEGPKEFRGGNS